MPEDESYAMKALPRTISSSSESHVRPPLAIINEIVYNRTSWEFLLTSYAKLPMHLGAFLIAFHAMAP